MGRHTEALADAQQAAALAVTPWDEVHAYTKLIGLYGNMNANEQGRRLLYEATAKLEPAVAACEAAGVPSTDKVLQDGIEMLWTMKHQTAHLQQDYAAALVYVRKLRALAKQEGHWQKSNPIHLLGAEARALVYLGRVEEAMALLVQAVHSIKSAKVQEGIFMLNSIPSCVDACEAMGDSAVAHSFLRTAEDIVRRAREAPDSEGANDIIEMQSNDAALARMKAAIARLDGDAAGAAAHWRSVLELQRQQQGMCCAEGCTNSFQANGEKLLMCSACKKAWYCSAVCQKADWKARHKASCSR